MYSTVCCAIRHIYLCVMHNTETHHSGLTWFLRKRGGGGGRDGGRYKEYGGRGEGGVVEIHTREGMDGWGGGWECLVTMLVEGGGGGGGYHSTVTKHFLNHHLGGAICAMSHIILRIWW